MATVWISRYALTEGIFELYEYEIRGDFVYWTNENSRGHSYIPGKNRHWHGTKDEALTRAELMRLRKIKSLEKQILKLKDMSFKLESADEHL